MESFQPLGPCDDPTFSITAIFRRMFRNDQVAAWLLSRDLEPPTVITTDMLKQSVTSESRIITREKNNEGGNPSTQTGKTTGSSSTAIAKDGSATEAGYGTTFFKKFDRVAGSGNSSSSSDAMALIPKDDVAEPETIACVLHGMCGNYAFMTVADTRIPFAFLERGSDVMPGVRRMVVELTHEDTFIMACYWKTNGRSSLIAMRYPHDMSKVSHKCFLLIAPYPVSRYPTAEDVMEVGWMASPYQCQFCLLRGNLNCECSQAVIQRTRPQPPPVERRTPWNMWSFIYGCCESGFKRNTISLYNFEKKVGANAQVIHHISPTFENVKQHAHGYRHYIDVIEPVYTRKALGWRVTGSDQQQWPSIMVPNRQQEQRSHMNENTCNVEELRVAVEKNDYDEQQEPKPVNPSLGVGLSDAPSNMSLSAWMLDGLWNEAGLVNKLDLPLTTPFEAVQPQLKPLDPSIEIPALFGPGIASRSEPLTSHMLLPRAPGIMSALIAGWDVRADSNIVANTRTSELQTALKDSDPQHVDSPIPLPMKTKGKKRVRGDEKASWGSEENKAKAKKKGHSKDHDEQVGNDENEDTHEAACNDEFDKDKHEALAYLAEIDAMDLHHDTHCSCRLCDTPFTRKYDLKRHIKTTHLDFRNFACDLCGNKFKRKQHLNVHKTLVHEKASMNLACPYCESVLTSESNYRRHLRQVHQKDPLKEEGFGRAGADEKDDGDGDGDGDGDVAAAQPS